jgi:AcrR family transcriptional regulator
MPAMKARSTYHHGDLKKSLVNEARKLLNEDGYEKFSLRRLAKQVGVSAMAPYRHYKTKEELLGAIVDDALEQFALALEKSVPHDAPLVEQMVHMCIGYIRFFVNNPDILKILFVEVRNRNATMMSQDKTKDLAEKLRNQKSFHMYSTLAKRITPQLPGLSDEEAIMAIWARAHGLAVLISQETWLYDAEKITDEMLEKMIRTAI